MAASCRKHVGEGIGTPDLPAVDFTAGSAVSLSLSLLITDRR